ncbi:hypothetical protein N474_12115 [Pseudoalteromonas luteoviolacea CPMOR-2]|uniref:TonB-denpendent receptor n=1 Tax=Pseudoalteromonas luteoviolacea DSM 6061 TaxID=1365250 RepID=A0A167CBI4_9GAMM|nr:TonB-dependent receptor [Pseudoalteromonas luteoviolacea]KZN47465.1 hypothetical protein N475_06200 [Pseudoalteromonas luteoviolacea DSM 6061]KZN56016.1 hypothetical protein N474_12115 [Pseudoalteromonas luteoviolacea CPMOR-2]MBE0388642.1 hypothetical protein [Pseudoalteromonas luteoviolacea DSM 6061]
MRNIFIRKTILGIAISSALGANQQAAAQESGAQEEKIEKIAVTGSRILRQGMTTVAPVMVISSDELNVGGSLNVGDVLATLPQFAQGIESTDNAYNPANAGLSVPDLRGLGEIRTLVLINGRRPAQTVDSSGLLVTDVSNIPARLIERVEILTGGASSIYGSDAVAGVINVILKESYNDFTVDAQAGTSEQGDAESQSLTLTYGKEIDGGNIMMSFDFFNQESLRVVDRKGARGQTSYIRNPDGDNPRNIILNNVGWSDYNITPDRPTFMIDKTYNYYQFQRQDDGQLGEGYLAILDSELHSYYKQSHDLNPNLYSSAGPTEPIQPYQRYSAYVTGNYELPSDIYMTGSVSYSKVSATTQLDPEFIFSNKGWVDITDAPFTVPQQVIDTVKQAGTGSNWIAIPYTFNDFGNRTTDTEREYFGVSLSFEGELNNGWVWDAYVASGQTTSQATSFNRINSERYDGGYTLIGECEPNCPEFNPFMPLSKEVVDYLRLDPFTDERVISQHTFSANITGDIFDLPAGYLSFATGVEIRKEGMEVNLSETTLLGLNRNKKSQNNDVDRTVKEAYVELVVPVLSDVPAVKQLDIETAYRKANYTYAGTTDSWKLGINWAVTDDLRLRAVKSKAVRAPQLTELLSPSSITFIRGDDPCDATEIDTISTDKQAIRKANCQALGLSADFNAATNVTTGVDVTVSGNEQLEVETAYTKTVGLVFTPSFIEDLSLTVDYFDIDLNDGIARFGAFDTAEMCVDSATINNGFCAQVTRAADGNITNINDTWVNANLLSRRGVDVGVYYPWKLGDYGSLQLSAYATRIINSTFVDSPLEGETVFEYAGSSGTPEWKGSFVAKYSLNDLSVRWKTNYVHSVLYRRDVTAEDYEQHVLPTSVLHHLRVGYYLNDDFEVYFNVNNVMDKDWLGHPGTSSGGSTYPITGRSFILGLSYTL